MKRLSIAIDGPAGAGKSSVSKILSARLGYAYLDTGAMYRAVTYAAQVRGITAEEDIAKMAQEIRMEVRPGREGMHVITDGEDVTAHLRTPEVSADVSRVSAIPAVRTALVELQRKQAEKGGIVLDGRDIGTTVLPRADVKIFLTASVRTRAVRRFEEITKDHPEMDLPAVEKEIERRDRLDSTRAVSPLRQAEDAVLLDNGDLTLEGTAEKMIEICREKFPGFDKEEA